MKKRLLFNLLILTIVLLSCVKKETVNNAVPTDPTSKTIKDLTIPTSFDFKTTKDVSLGILVTNSYENLPGVPVSVYLDNPGVPEARNTNARLYGTFVSQSDGRIDETLNLPTLQDSLYLTTQYIGIESESGFSISGTSASYTYGTGNTVKSSYLPAQSTSSLKAALTYTFLSSFDTKGVPGNLALVNDAISGSFLSSLNTTLPESKNLTVAHPGYFTEGSAGNIVLKEDANLWITFVGEGAGNKNSLGYYIYDPLKAPKSITEIDKLNIIFPNLSLKGSGGGLVSGNKVNLGKFTKGQAIGWFLVGSGWNGTTVSGSTLFFSDPALNPENDPAKRQHTILITNSEKSHIVLGFEDTDRESAKTDNDFNDAIFQITANPTKAIQIDNISEEDNGEDSDKDGVIDSQDESPQNANESSSNYYPGKAQYTSLLVEDLWPSLGDFDFNDLVVDCNFRTVLNSKSKVVGLYIKYKVRAIGASFKNGFGIQLPVSPSVISSVTSKDSQGVVTSLSTEAGNDKAVVIAFYNAFTLLPSTGGQGVNVIKGNGWSEPKEVELHIVFASPQTVASLGNAPYNPFVFIDGDRTKEIHLAGAQPTTKANTALFGTGNDDTNPAKGKYYKSTNNLVWMMEVPSSFQYAIEKNDLSKAYLKFAGWAESGGSLNKDWYMDKPGYRTSSLIYSK